MQRRPITTRVPAPHDVEDRLQRALQENNALKQQKNELEERLKRVQTQFRRLAADWHHVQEGLGGSSVSAAARTGITSALQGSTPPLRPHSASEAAGSTAAGPSEHGVLLPSLKSTSPNRFSATLPSNVGSPHSQKMSSICQVETQKVASEAELAACKAALARSQLELQQLRASAAAAAQARVATVASSSPPQIPAAPSTSESSSALAAARQEAASLRSQLQKVREELNATLFAQENLQSQSSHTLQGLQQQLQGSASAQHQLEAQYRASIDTLTREKQQLEMKVRLFEAAKQASSAENEVLDRNGMITLQSEIHRKTSEVTLLHSRLQGAQAQVETLKGECNRLVEELRQAHAAHADTKKTLFTMEHEAASLRAQCGSLHDVEMALQRKQEENAHLEQELLKLVGSLQACNRETEAAVRLEFQSRLADLQEMRDTADRERRETERKLLNSNHDIAELKRKLESAQEDLLMYKTQIAKVEKERSLLSAQVAFAGRTVTAATAAGVELNEDEIHRALALAAMKKRASPMPSRRAGRAISGDGGGDGTASPAAEAGEALDIFEALNWDDDWEQGQLREALATAAMDLELAETRCQQMSEQVEQYRATLRKVSEERDMLLEEGIALRGRVTHVQTIFAKQQLQAYRKATAANGSGSTTDGLIAFTIRGMHSEETAMCRALRIPDLKSPVSFFFTVDGLADYEAMVGPTLRSLDEVDGVRFQYDNLSKDTITLATLEQTSFCFQLHCAAGEESRVVAMAELTGTALLAAREGPVEDTLELTDGEGQVVGSLVLEFSCARLVLPILLGASLSDPRAGVGAFTLSATEIQSAMVALRAARYLRVQVFRAQGLAGAAESATLPQPYVFYTASSPLGGLSCIRDTVVHPSSRTFTTDPVFDAAPTDHRVIVDPALVRFIVFGVINFVVFDARATDVQLNLGVGEVALRPLLNSLHATINATLPLHQQGSLSVGVSWVSGA